MFVVYDVIVTLATCRGCHLQRGNIRKGKLLACATMVVKRDRIECLTFNYISVAPSIIFFVTRAHSYWHAMPRDALI
jgi:hypothetical protein